MQVPYESQKRRSNVLNFASAWAFGEKTCRTLLRRSKRGCEYNNEERVPRTPGYGPAYLNIAYLVFTENCFPRCCSAAAHLAHAAMFERKIKEK